VRCFVLRLFREGDGTNTAGLAVLLVVLLIVLAAATEFGRALTGPRVPRNNESAIVAAQQQQALHQQRVAAAQGARSRVQNPQRTQQKGRLGIAGQSSVGAPVQPASALSRSAPARWGRQLGNFLLETLPDAVLDLVQAIRREVRRFLS
jgi:uncharacterized protein HemX